MRVLKTFVAVTLTCSLAACGRSEEPKLADGPSAEVYARLYPAIQETSPSVIHGDLMGIVRERLACYENIFAFGDRLADCQTKYLLDIILMARQKIDSAPMLGECILSLKLCPIAYAMCKGEAESPGAEACVEREVQAIELVLDNYWRGTSSRHRTF